MNHFQVLATGMPAVKEQGAGLDSPVRYHPREYRLKMVIFRQSILAWGIHPKIKR